MQKVMNLTTVRTHQYAVWITIGFFEVTRQGDPLMANANPGTSLATLGFDILGPEIGASSGQTTRYRGFFLVDRLQLTGFTIPTHRQLHARPSSTARRSNNDADIGGGSPARARTIHERFVVSGKAPCTIPGGRGSCRA